MIDLFHVSFKYPGSREEALRDLTLHLEKGELAFLTGPSGAGKSSLLRLIFGAEKPSRGQVVIAGHNVSRLTNESLPYLRRNIGMVFQDFKLLPGRTVFDNVAIVLEVLGKSRSYIRPKVLNMLKEVGLTHKAESLPETLSGGEQQRVAMARALVGDPQILLCDEPTGNLDKRQAGEIMALIKKASIRGTTILIATHDPTLLSGNERLFRLEEGRLVAD